MNLNLGLFTSNKEEWETPQELFDELNHEFNFDTDLCASDKNTKCRRYVKKGDCYYSTGIDKSDSLPYVHKSGFMNPPYGRKIGEFVRKAYLLALKEGKTIVCLLPARTDTRWWHNYCMKAYEIRFLKGRVKFINPDNRTAKPQPAPFPSAIVIFRPKETLNAKEM